MTLEEFYAAVGGDYEEVRGRIPSERMIRRFIEKYSGDKSFDTLAEAVKKEDWETAFRAAHTLKGVAQNLGFLRLYRTASALTEEVRGGNILTDKSLLTAVRETHGEVLRSIDALEE